MSKKFDVKKINKIKERDEYIFNDKFVDQSIST